ncbi:MarR family winged helix-turn-helix transcriptional regulator [Ruminiclostridium cellobioparum]|uniref:Transcriptional regulator n=1 Tax=Ruminiclostridium cellobioparum subsp. termitidis CT1112 TaxID=1195236 RepID=S0FTS8_RUMCE|nr:MarR family transcriptional regulator [Ruminiclostridium cellobioparum]EMS72579.1 transcriptional regulator [Ruminiclostridium cellobioparum subsp. termitidis CT1112]
MDYSKELRELFLMQQAYATLMAVANKLEAQDDKYYKGLTSRQYMAILAVFHLPPEETTVKNIAKKLGTTKQNANQLIAAIEKKGYIIISASERDKRAINIKVTESGMQAILKSTETGVIFMSEVFKNFAEHELDTLWYLLKKVYSFDGEEHDGFEEDASGRLEGDHSNLQLRVLEEFRKRRNGQK